MARRKGNVTELHRRVKASSKPIKHDHGVFVWTAENRYPKAKAKKVFKSEKVAQKYADKYNGCGYVVRPIYD
jgi:adenosine/AMP kinase